MPVLKLWVLLVNYITLSYVFSRTPSDPPAGIGVGNSGFQLEHSRRGRGPAQDRRGSGRMDRLSSTNGIRLSRHLRRQGGRPCDPTRD